MVEALDDGEAVARSAAGGPEGHVGVRFPATPDTMTGTALADGVSVVVDDFAADERFGATSASITATGMVGGAGFVIRLADRLWGMICVSARAAARLHGGRPGVPGVGGERDRRARIERTESEQTIRHQAMHDALTGIPNRSCCSTG